jgi:divalent metal cation (Fe/Co/Zn/Cd) transporter
MSQSKTQVLLVFAVLAYVVITSFMGWWWGLPGGAMAVALTVVTAAVYVLSVRLDVGSQSKNKEVE